MSIARCPYCDNQYDQDTNVEHEEICFIEKTTTDTKELVKMGFLSDVERSKIIKDINNLYSLEKMIAYMSGIDKKIKQSQNPDETWEDKARTDAYIDKKYDQHVDDKLTEEADLKRWGISMDIHPLN